MAANQSTWAQLRQQARAQETQTEALFHIYAQYASQTDISPKPSKDEQRTEEQLNEILEKRSQLLTSLSRLLDSDPTPSALKSTNLSRHREILTQHRTELLRLRNTLSTARDRANLLSNVRSDISAYRASTTNPENAESEYMLQERTRLDRSHNVADSVLSQAYAVNESFGIQRESLQSIQRRITGAAGKVPGINGLMQRIGSKKRRDGIILGSFIAVCVLVLFWFW
ncbi:protein transport protein gos1 [Extremus antarcticus]|uniref:Golgi SNAP receptor complex member 1 n=1 Tax=Extremus antarcticus TaxID=702011 RepID=A0AAJ0DCV7_9PEZI|nr:protein transport protein gos1 [Extremus antarcticus]